MQDAADSPKTMRNAEIWPRKDTERSNMTKNQDKAKRDNSGGACGVSLLFDPTHPTCRYTGGQSANGQLEHTSRSFPAECQKGCAMS